MSVDLVVVDGTSLLDLALATKLLEAVPKSAHIILLGDKDQLAAVDIRAVFSEPSADPTLSIAGVRTLGAVSGIPTARIECPAPIEPTCLRDAVVGLTENFRFAGASGIGRLRHKGAQGARFRVRQGTVAAAGNPLAW